MYQPKLLPEQIRALYFVKEYDGRPMTHHIRVAVERYLAEYPRIEEILSEARTGGESRARGSQVVERAPHYTASTVEDVGIDHRGLDVAVAE